MNDALAISQIQEMFPDKKVVGIDIISMDHDAGEYVFMGGDYIKILKWMEIKQNLLKNDKNKSSVCLTLLTNQTHKQLRNRYINIFFLNYINAFISSFLGVYYEN